MPNWLKNILLIYLSYLGFSLFFIQPLLNIAPHQFLQRSYERQLDTTIIYYNPFAIGVVAHNASLRNPDGSDFIAFQRAEVNLSLQSLWQTGWVLDRVQLAELVAKVTLDRDGRLNFDDFLASETEPAEPEADSGLPGLTIRDLDLASRRIEFRDESREEPFGTHLEDFAIRVSDLSTVLEDGKPYSLSARGEDGGELFWQGTVSIPGANSEGLLRLSNISLLPAWRFAAPWLNFRLLDARLSIEGQYRVSWAEELSYRIGGARLELAGLDIQPVDKAEIPDTGLSLAALAVTGIELDSAGTVTVAEIALRDPVIRGWSEGDRVSLAELFAIEQEPATAEQPDNGSDEGGWTAHLDATRITGGTINWRTEYTDPSTTTIAPLDLSLGAINWPLAGATPGTLNLIINDRTEVNISGDLDLGSGDGQFQMSLQDLQLPWFAPAIPEAFQASLDGGSVAGEGTLSLSAFAPDQLTMDGDIRDLAITMASMEDSISGWQALHWKDLAVDFTEQHVTLDTLRLNAFQGRLHIFADGSINTSNVLQQELEKADVDVDEAAEAAQAWGFDVRSFQMTDSRVDFMDESLPIVFRTVIGDLDGEVSGLSSDPSKTASVDFQGSVDGYAPVNLEGSLRPMASPPALDLGLGFEGVDLARLTPYSGTYAGYAIERGVMTLNVRYALEENRLKGDNKLVIDQLKLGEKIDSEQAVDLPLELGIALLTNANGVIDLSVPVSGDVNDPGFSLGGVISSAFINLITKAATAPFNLLANLVGSEDDLQRVNFPAGSSELDTQAQDKLFKLAEAFSQRPELTLLIDGRINPDLDRVRLQKNALAAEFITAGIAEDQVSAKGPDWAAAIEKRYRALGLPEADDAGNPLSIRKRYETVAASISLPEGSLQALAEERAVETKRFLVNEAGMEAERAVIDSVDLSEENHTFSGVEMDLR